MKYQHGDFQNKVTIKAHILDYPYPPIQFPICTELTHKTKRENYISTGV